MQVSIPFLTHQNAVLCYIVKSLCALRTQWPQSIAQDCASQLMWTMLMRSCHRPLYSFLPHFEVCLCLLIEQFRDFLGENKWFPTKFFTIEHCCGLFFQHPYGAPTLHTL